MNIIEATKLMKEKGLTCARNSNRAWHVKYVSRQTNNEIYAGGKNGETIIQKYVKEDLVYAKIFSENRYAIFTATYEDIVANDWEIVE